MTRKTRINNQRNDTLQPGYCEVCRVEYSQLAKHLQSEKHQEFINDNANFITLDTLIDDSANIETFLKLHGTEIKGTVTLLVVFYIMPSEDTLSSVKAASSRKTFY